jgi:hypothetical protein
MAMPRAFAQGIGHQRRGRGRVDGPADHAPGIRVAHDCAVDLALAGGMLRDIRDPQLIRHLIRRLARELAADPIRGGGIWRRHMAAACGADFR